MILGKLHSDDTFLVKILEKAYDFLSGGCVIDDIDAGLERALKVLEYYADVVQTATGVYKMTNKHDVIMYVGKAKNLKKRLESYKRFDKLPVRLRHMLRSLHSISFIYTDRESEALLLEARLIKQLRPRYNLLMKDDKSFTYISMTQGLLPAALVGHQRKKVPPGEHYGPFASVKAAQGALDSLAKIFRLRTCPDSFYRQRTKPCLQYQIQRCSAPCVEKITHEEYARDVYKAKQFLRGRTSDVESSLQKDIDLSVSNTNYERASFLKERLQLIKKFVSMRIPMGSLNEKSVDVIGHAVHGEFINFYIRFIQSAWDYGKSQYLTINQQMLSEEDAMMHFVLQFYSNRRIPNVVVLSTLPQNVGLLHEALVAANAPKDLQIISADTQELQHVMKEAILGAQRDIGERMRVRAEMEGLLEKLRAQFLLEGFVRRVELYDNSHLQMTTAFGAMILFTSNGFEKSAYRKFSFKNPLAYRQDDATMMAEVLRRRFSLEGADFPDLIILDGGKVHLAAAQEVLQEYAPEVSVVAMAKQERELEEKFYIPDHKEAIKIEDEELLQFLQRLRDEVHRYALACHRMSRNRQMFHPGDDYAMIPGIGEVRWKRLKESFGSFEEICKASVEDLMRVQGFNRRIAESIVYYISQNKEKILNE